MFTVETDNKRVENSNTKIYNNTAVIMATCDAINDSHDTGTEKAYYRPHW